LASPLPGFTPTSAFPSPLLPFTNLGPLNRISHALAIRGGDLLFGRLVREWRAETLGLTRHRSPPAAAGTIYAYSPHVVPKPRDWGDDVLVCGYWFLDSPDWQPDAELAAFLQAGPPPIHIGFGSMPGVDAERMTEVVVEALARTGKRGLLATGGGALVPSQATPFVRSISGAPHDRLFPHVGATVHHGGAGTTGAALRAGKPTVACPFFGDQPFWGRRIAQLGAGPPALDRGKLTPAALADALVAMDAPTHRACATRLGEAIGSESGVSTAVTYIWNAVERRAAQAV
jgi:UDP:flavonoid glycosyltransferase YjiC (YdhE family)